MLFNSQQFSVVLCYGLVFLMLDCFYPLVSYCCSTAECVVVLGQLVVMGLQGIG